ncbi:hypothetical protein evm_012782 [Chilo suppressalis]|nr:hypothetical protein evm_012782 [Chilo suppressalis]
MKQTRLADARSVLPLNAAQALTNKTTVIGTNRRLETSCKKTNFTRSKEVIFIAFCLYSAEQVANIMKNVKRDIMPKYQRDVIQPTAGHKVKKQQNMWTINLHFKPWGYSLNCPVIFYYGFNYQFGSCYMSHVIHIVTQNKRSQREYPVLSYVTDVNIKWS